MAIKPIETVPIPRRECGEFLRVVALADIDLRPPWNAARLERLREMDHEAFVEFMMAVPLRFPAWTDEDEDLPKDYNGCAVYERDASSGEKRALLGKSEEDERYSVHNGIHRMNLAKERGITHILAWVQECRQVK